MRHLQLELVITISSVLLGAAAYLLHVPGLEFIALLTGAIGLGMLLARTTDPDG
jgi:hypothetical protein